MPSIAEDRDEIFQLMYRYNHTIDGGQPERWADCFTDDGVLEAAGNAITGRDELVKFAASVHGMRHVVANPLIEVVGDAATLEAYVLVYHGKDLATMGTYADQLVRAPSGWKFVRRVFTPDN